MYTSREKILELTVPVEDHLERERNVLRLIPIDDSLTAVLRIYSPDTHLLRLND